MIIPPCPATGCIADEFRRQGAHFASDPHIAYYGSLVRNLYAAVLTASLGTELRPRTGPRHVTFHAGRTQHSPVFPGTLPRMHPDRIAQVEGPA